MRSLYDFQTNRPKSNNYRKINLIPEGRRKELYELIHQFRIGLERPKHNQNEIMQFAGSWLDMPEEDFSDFCEEIEQRRCANKIISVRLKYSI